VKIFGRGLVPVLPVIAAFLAMPWPAVAHVVEVTTSVGLEEVKDAEALRTAVSTAVDKARAEAIAFEPSVVAVTGVRVFGERLLIGLLFADEDGKAMLEALQDGRAPRGGSTGRGPAPDGKLRI